MRLLFPLLMILAVPIPRGERGPTIKVGTVVQLGHYEVHVWKIEDGKAWVTTPYFRDNQYLDFYGNPFKIEYIQERIMYGPWGKVLP